LLRVACFSVYVRRRQLRPIDLQRELVELAGEAERHLVIIGYRRAGVCLSDKMTLMDKNHLILKRASASRSSGQWSDDDFDVFAEGVVVGRIFKSNAAPVASPWMWTLLFGHHEDRTPTHGYAETREAAMASFAKRWLRE
jgi:hypothetical protein